MYESGDKNNAIFSWVQLVQPKIRQERSIACDAGSKRAPQLIEAQHHLNLLFFSIIWRIKFDISGLRSFACDVGSTLC